MPSTLYNVEITGLKGSMSQLQQELQTTQVDDVEIFEFKGATGASGVWGLVAKIPSLKFDVLLAQLKRLHLEDRTLKIKINDLELVARDFVEAKNVLDLLEEKGLLKNSNNDE